MLSVLIPTYNYLVVSLVKSLHQQLLEQKIPFEIISFDNGSESKLNLKNEEINKINFCKFISLNKNGGRSKIRNLLAQNAKYDWLLFLDADVLPVSENFIKNYLETTNTNIQKVVYGGLKYDDIKPSKDKLLRWVYGKNREEIPLKTRKLNPSQHFSSANFLIDRTVFNKIQFDEELTEYGHEDTLLAISLKNKNIEIHQIDNPVFHLGLDVNKIFIEKSKKAIENLLYLQKQQKINSNEIKLLKSFENLKKIKLISIISFFYKKYSKKMEFNLNSNKPSLFIYDIYKIGYLCSIFEK